VGRNKGDHLVDANEMVRSIKRYEKDTKAINLYARRDIYVAKTADLSQKVICFSDKIAAKTDQGMLGNSADNQK
jgi:hypothetical protein